jgi:hypothetical protein
LEGWKESACGQNLRRRIRQRRERNKGAWIEIQTPSCYLFGAAQWRVSLTLLKMALTSDSPRGQQPSEMV